MATRNMLLIVAATTFWTILATVSHFALFNLPCLMSMMLARTVVESWSTCSVTGLLPILQASMSQLVLSRAARMAKATQRLNPCRTTAAMDTGTSG